MPKSGFDVPQVNYQMRNTFSEYVDKLLNYGMRSGSGLGLSGLMGGMGLGLGRMGSLSKDERKQLKQRLLINQASNAIMQDAAFREGVGLSQLLSAKKANDKLRELDAGVIARYAKQFGIEAEDLSDALLGNLKDQAKARLKAVEESRGDYGWEGFKQGMVRAGRAVSRLWNTQEEADADVQRSIQERLDFERSNAYAQDQALRAQEGEGAWSRAEGLGGIVANSAEALGNMAPQLASTLLGRGIGTAAGSALGAASPIPGGAALGAQVGGLLGTALGGGLPGAAQGRFDYAERVMSDPNLTPEQKQEALEGYGITAAGAVGGALGSIPFGLRDAARMVAPRIPFTQAGKRFAELSGKVGADEARAQMARAAIIDEAKRGFTGNLGRSLKWSVPETALMLGGGVAGSNLAYSMGTGQDVPLMEGWQEAAVSGVPMAGMMGVMGAVPRMRAKNIPRSWRDDGSIRPSVAQYRQMFAEQAKGDTNFGGKETSQLLSQFRKDYATQESFDAMVAGMEPTQRDVLMRMYAQQPQQKVVPGGASLERQLAANQRAVAKKEAKQEQAKPTVVRVEDAYNNRIDNPDEWARIKKEQPEVAKQFEFVSRQLNRMDAKVREMYDRLRADETSVTPDEVYQWLYSKRTDEELNAARDQLIRVLTEGKSGSKGIKNRSYTFDKFEHGGIISELLKGLQNKNFGLHKKQITRDNVRDYLRFRQLLDVDEAPVEPEVSAPGAVVEPQTATNIAPEPLLEPTVKLGARDAGQPTTADEPAAAADAAAGAAKLDSATRERLVRDVLAREAGSDTAPFVPNLPVEAATTEGSTTPPVRPSEQSIRDYLATESGRSSWAEAQDERTRQAIIRYLEQAWPEQRREGGDAGRLALPPADELQETSIIARSDERQDSGSTNGIKLEESDSLSKQASAKVTSGYERSLNDFANYISSNLERIRRAAREEAPDETAIVRTEQEVSKPEPEVIDAQFIELPSTPIQQWTTVVDTINNLPLDKLEKIVGITKRKEAVDEAGNKIRVRKADYARAESDNELRARIYRSIFDGIIDPPPDAPKEVGAARAVIKRLIDNTSDPATFEKLLASAKDETINDQLYNYSDMYRMQTRDASTEALGINEAFAELMTNPEVRERVRQSMIDAAATPEIEQSVGVVRFDGYSLPVDTPEEVFNAAHAMGYRPEGRSIISKITGVPADANRNAFNNARTEMMQAFYKASVDPDALSGRDAAVWSKMENAGFKPVMFSDSFKQMVALNAKLHNIEPETYFSAMYNTGETIDSILSFSC